METMDLTAFLGLVVGATQVIKDEFKARGINLGNWSRLIAFVLGGLGTYIMAYHSELWETLIPILVMVLGTGGFSVAKELTRKTG